MWWVEIVLWKQSSKGTGDKQLSDNTLTCHSQRDYGAKTRLAQDASSISRALFTSVVALHPQRPINVSRARPGFQKTPTRRRHSLRPSSFRPPTSTCMSKLLYYHERCWSAHQSFVPCRRLVLLPSYSALLELSAVHGLSFCLP